MIGFMPGFPYMGELPDALITPRLKTPRLSVPAGSVAIAQKQTGIYPVESPGGWQILGRTPVKLFNPEKEPPALLRMGDLVQFRPISEKEFHEWKD
jgi:inhibitor of KinA